MRHTQVLHGVFELTHAITMQGFKSAWSHRISAHGASRTFEAMLSHSYEFFGSDVIGHAHPALHKLFTSVRDARTAAPAESNGMAAVKMCL